jgi:peptidoglycan hydrolase CwlO-like protein
MNLNHATCDIELEISELYLNIKFLKNKVQLYKLEIERIEFEITKDFKKIEVLKMSTFSENELL